MITTIDAGQIELSIGFWTRAVDAPEGSGARYAQVDLLGNHVASVPRGRAGPACRVILDHAAICAYDPEVTEKRDLGGVEHTDYPMPDGTILQVPTPVVQLLTSYEGKIAELRAEIMSEENAPPEAAPEAPAAPAPEAAPDEERDSVRVDRASAEALILARMPHMDGKLDGLDLDTLFTAALAMPEQRADVAPEPPAANPYAEPAKAQRKRDSRDIAPIANYLHKVIG